MKHTMVPALFVLGVALVGIPAFVSAQTDQPERVAQDKKKQSDIDKLYKMVQRARADLRALRKQAGIRGEPGEERREGRAEHGAGRREGRAEHGEGRRREGRGDWTDC
jgi:hypothetical protein